MKNIEKNLGDKSDMGTKRLTCSKRSLRKKDKEQKRSNIWKDNERNQPSKTHKIRSMINTKKATSRQTILRFLKTKDKILEEVWKKAYYL